MPTILPFVEQIQQQAIYQNHRRIIRLCGDIDWCYQQATIIIKALDLPYFWCGSSPVEINAVSYKQILGQETSLLFINALSNFDANLFAASEGTLRGGGLLILMSPVSIPLDDVYYQYIVNQLDLMKVAVIQQDHPLPLSTIISSSSTPSSTELNINEQQTAIKAIIKTIKGHRRRPLVLTAKRGRGKSAALGIASAELIKSGVTTILACAPNKTATQTLFKHASLLLTGNTTDQFSITYNNSCIQFIAPDVLLADLPKCDLLIIDEAAALPVPMLETLAHHYSRLVFATTTHGYEGSGRGFALRFQQHLKMICPQYRQYHLHQPIRWADNDPVEAFTLNTLCLTESPFDSPDYQADLDIQFEQINVQQLLTSPTLLKEIFSLLVLAHYQTKPSDLTSLLNDKSLTIFALTQNKRVLGVALITKEGGFTSDISEQVWKGNRRLQGNLVAQSLAFHCAQKEAATFLYARIQRIAIHPTLQHQGLGKKFIKQINKWASTKQYDHLCVSFGATPTLYTFWQDLGFTTLRIGLSKDKSSGTHSVIMNFPISESAKNLHSKIQQQFHHQLEMQLCRHLYDIDSELVLKLLSELNRLPINPDTFVSYIDGNLPYEFAESYLIKLLMNSELKILRKIEQSLTIQKVLQNNSWAEVCKKNQLTGKKQAKALLKSAIKQLIKEDNHASR
ncbi:tRNA(Met) cytidine acetyltransferase TmcA [Psychromonas sp. PT13]|uniref:tRNA(Met) cytidine acetyltransferase TmcA n=1 Tax=Psychromonas sp. PT13 TaxID=3439547 RepID=UPI003EBC0927